MKKLKAIIIENELVVDMSIQAFVKDNKKQFVSIQEELYCLQRDKADLLPEILKNDAIIVASTWMYKDQLEEFLDAFLDQRFPKKMIFFVHRFVRTLNSWKYNGYSEEKRIFEKVKTLLSNGHKLYDYMQNPTKKSTIKDGLNSDWANNPHHERSKVEFWEMKYSKEHDLFYIDHEYFTLKSMLEEEKEKQTKKSF